MSADEKVALDALEAVGVSGLSMFHLRCLASYLSGARVLKVGHQQFWDICDRFQDDMRWSLDELHGLAEWEHAERTALASARRGRPASGRFA